ncbi:pyrimidine reductase family protein [Herbiconiux moechotypicola]|uniref:Pyrimidine reductase family protein n=1 Tax=Herbiconiux moechotypicola TaxID=637393 RepID=A0ABN3D868_9MICO|nr:pyrimidine reductase family protein [Herbiconiux moechotypicola]MCS5728302.1 pyrimidine reductase family protein [Herbiconiux moechotypicola]
MSAAVPREAIDSFPEIVPVLPVAGAPLDAEALLQRFSAPDRSTPTLRVNFIQSIDGSATLGGLSGALGGPADKAVFDTLRAVSDVVLAGAGTARDEGYGALTVAERFVDWRVAHGLPPHPVMALVSGSLDLDPQSALFRQAPVRPIVFTTRRAPQDARERLREVADVVDAGEEHADPTTIRASLTARGLRQVLCEGGPSLFGAFVAADQVDELCLTTSPMLEGGAGPRIASAVGAASAARAMELDSLLRSGSMLLARWVRARGDSGSTGVA